jgi:hypothetical protein
MPLDETSKVRGTDLSPSSSGYAAAPLPCPGRALAMGRSLTKSLEAEAACARLSSGHAAASVEVAAAKGGGGGGPGGVACGTMAMRVLPDLYLMERWPESLALEKAGGEAGVANSVAPGDNGVVSVEVVRHHRLCVVLLGSSSCKRES